MKQFAELRCGHQVQQMGEWNIISKIDSHSFQLAVAGRARHRGKEEHERRNKVRKRNVVMAAFATLLAIAATALGRTVEFSGYQWEVRPTEQSGGPGPNHWDENNVSVDSKGYLHMKLTQRNNQWYCSEVYLPQALGFGLYQFSVIGRVDALDPNVVLGLFNYLGPDGSNEIDIEFAHWGDPVSLIDNYTVYPAESGTEPTTRSFPFELSGAGNSTHTFNWTPSSILFQSFRGRSDNPSVSWLFRPRDAQRRIPQISLPVHINLWLFQGQAPIDGKEVELIVRSFTFTAM